MDNPEYCPTPKESAAWEAAPFFEQLVAKNRLAREKKFAFRRVTGLQGMEEAVRTLTTTPNFVAVDVDSPGYIELVNTPKTRRVTTIFIFMKHASEDMDARGRCMSVMREIFRQFMSKLVQERVRLQQKKIYVDSRISFTEIDRYAIAGGACAYFQIATDTFTDLRFNSEDWLP